ncbi:MAG: dephospho-CoA kinase [Desulfurobacteriaceae bacterium]
MIVAITGNIGSGKSTVSNLLKAFGYKVFNADEIGKKVLLKGRKGYKRVLEAFGEKILTKDDEIDTRKLASIVFSDKEKLDLLTSITHPLILEEILDIKKKYKREIVFVEAAIAIEYGWEEIFDYVVLVFAYRGQRLLRAGKKFGLKEAIKRESFQLSYREKIPYSHFMVCNTENLLHLKNQILDLVKYLEREIEK